MGNNFLEKPAGQFCRNYDAVADNIMGKSQVNNLVNYEFQNLNFYLSLFNDALSNVMKSL